MNYEVISTTYDLAFRSGANVTFDKILDTGNARIVTGYVLKNTKMVADAIIELTAVVKNSSGTIVGSVGDKWARIVSVNGEPESGYVAVIHMGGIMSTAKEITETPPSQYPTVIGGTVVLRFSDGTVSQPVELRV